jgi:hypothetical protein
MRDAIESRSSASSLLMRHRTRASCAAGFLNIPKTPFTRLANPLCSLRWLSVSKSLIAIRGSSRHKNGHNGSGELTDRSPK